MASATEPTVKLPGRLASIDAYRGFIMMLMTAEVLEFSRVAKALPASGFWRFLARHQSHSSWVGCSLHDMIQPSFSFIVGVALPFSLARRAADGQPQWQRTSHAFCRALCLIFLGVFLRSIGRSQTYWTFEDTLTQIGLGYGFLYLLGLRSVRVQWAALATILAGYWLAFALYPLPGAAFDWSRAGVKPGWPNNLTGFAAHWNLNTNLAWAFDTWFLNLFPREHPFANNEGGYSTLSFIPTLGTMILGLIAGGVLRSDRQPLPKVRWLAMAGVACLAAGWALGAAGVCPVVKRIWTPGWTIYSGGWCFLLLAGFSLIVEAWGYRRWAFPLVVVGMNSIAIYCMSWLIEGFVKESLRTHLGPAVFEVAGPEFESILLGAAVMLIFWLILYWMYRRKLFLKV